MATALLTDEEIETRLGDLRGWHRDGATLVSDWKFRNFVEAMKFVNLVADAAEGANHHPDILVHGWNNVRLTLSTHSAGGLTANDFALAARIADMHP